MPAVIVSDAYVIPEWVVDHESYRRWAVSDDYPEHGRVAYLGGQIWTDNEMEQLFTHNQPKTRISRALDQIVEVENLGYFFSDRTLLSNLDALLSTEPDGMLVLYESVRAGRVRLTPGAQAGFVEVLGSPDLVLEIISRSSVRKDGELLRRLYWQAGVTEYWLVDARRDPPVFEILRRGTDGFAASLDTSGFGGQRSELLRRSFRLTRRVDPLGNPQCVVEVGPVSAAT